MVRKIKYICWFILLIPNILFSQEVVLWGQDTAYAGEQLSFLTYSDQITFKEKVLCTAQVDKKGFFKCSFNTSETFYTFLRLDAYEAFIYTEPGKNYEIILPEKKEKTMAEKLNPYFEPLKYHMGIENSSEKELNYQMAFFDEVYNHMLEENSYLIYIKSPKLDVDGAIKKTDSLFVDNNIKFFNDFKKYKYASFKHLSFHEKMKSISNGYYLNNEILYQNPAYMELFNQVYKDYFTYFARTDSGKQIYNDIGKLKSITALKKTLGNDEILKNDTLKELVILKCLHDEFYKDKFSRSAMLTVLDSLINQTTIPGHKKIGNNIKEKVIKLLVGYAPPAFKLYDKDSNLVSLDNFKGKYIYLGFCTTISYGCIKEFAMLQKLYERHKQHFEIVMICMDESLQQMKHFVERKGYQYTFLHYGNESDVFKEYDIRAFPTYYFIDKNGKLSISPAAPPDKNIEYNIFQVMRANGDI